MRTFGAMKVMVGDSQTCCRRMRGLVIVESFSMVDGKGYVKFDGIINMVPPS